MPGISISPKRTLRVLGLIILTLSCFSLVINFIRCFLGRGGLWGVSRLFDVDVENNIPTWYASVTLLICAGLLALITQCKRQQGDRFIKQWHWLSLIFLWMSIDEAASIHELFIRLDVPIEADGFFRYTWVVPAMGILIVLGLMYWKFLVTLPKLTKRLFLLAGTLYISGALVMEMIGGKYQQIVGIQLPVAVANNSGFTGMGMALILTLEEALEMCGVAVFIYALLYVLSRDFESNTWFIQFGDAEVGTSNFGKNSRHPAVPLGSD